MIKILESDFYLIFFFLTKYIVHIKERDRERELYMTVRRGKFRCYVVRLLRDDD